MRTAPLFELGKVWHLETGEVASSFRVAENVLCETLDNGLTVIIKEITIPLIAKYMILVMHIFHKQDCMYDFVIHIND